MMMMMLMMMMMMMMMIVIVIRLQYQVYGILGFQLVLTTLLGGAVMQWGKALVHTNPAAITTLLFGSMAASMVR
eukprot:5657304-Karenia_brevis.AAC.1